MEKETLNNDITEVLNADALSDKATEADTTSAEDVKTEPSVFKTFNTEEEFKKLIQSERSKAKNEIIQELGISSVSEFKNSLKEKEEIKAKLKEYENKMKQIEIDRKVDNLGIDDKFRKDFLTLVNARVAEGSDFDTAATDVLNNNQHYLKGTTTIKMGVEKSESENFKAEENARRKAFGLKPLN